MSEEEEEFALTPERRSLSWSGVREMAPGTPDPETEEEEEGGMEESATTGTESAALDLACSALSAIDKESGRGATGLAGALLTVSAAALEDRGGAPSSKEDRADVASARLMTPTDDATDN
jgi:hypothetical protein